MAESRKTIPMALLYRSLYRGKFGLRRIRRIYWSDLQNTFYFP